jgi:hypothetical protein
MRLLPTLCFPILLAGCGGGATVVTSSLPCHPPAEVMVKAEALVPISAATLTINEIIQGWVQDNQKYNILRNKDNLLIDWVNEHCQK